jgi:hypothetical protein
VPSVNPPGGWPARQAWTSPMWFWSNVRCGHAVGHRPAGMRARPAVTRPVVADQPKAARFRVGGDRGVDQPGVRRAVVNQHRPTGRITGLFDGQRPAIRALDGSSIACLPLKSF